MFKKIIIALATVLVLPAYAKEIQLVVPFPPGGPADTAGRLIAKGFNENSTDTMIVVNKPGAVGTIGAGFVAQSPADGSVLLLGGASSNFFAIINNNSGVTYTEKSFDEVAMIVKIPTSILVNTDKIKARTFPALVKELKQYPELASVGITNETGKFAAQKLFALTKSKVDIVPYNGSAPAHKDIRGGHLPILVDTSCPTLNLMKDSNVVPVLINSNKRMPQVADVPAVGELYPGADYSTWFAIYAPAGTPTDVLDSYNKIINTVITNSEYKDKFENCYGTVLPGTRQDFKNFVKNEHKKIN